MRNFKLKNTQRSYLRLCLKSSTKKMNLYPIYKYLLTLKANIIDRQTKTQPNINTGF